jgi:hypothetical protein
MLHRFKDCKTVKNRTTWGALDVSLTTVLGIHYIVAALAGVTQFSGQTALDIDTVTLYYPNGDVAGTVDLNYTHDFTGGLFIEAFPAKYNVYYSKDPNWSYNVSAASWAANVVTLTIGAHNVLVGEKVTVSGITPSGYNGTYTVTAITGTQIKYAKTANPGAYSAGGTVIRPPKSVIYDDGKSGAFTYYSPQLGAGTWYVLVRQVNDRGEESGGTTLTSQTIVHVPASPTLPSYVSGDYSNTVISWPASTGDDADAIYCGYDSLDLGVISSDVRFVHASGVGTLNQTLAAIDSGFTDTRYVVLRARKLGTETWLGNLVLGAATWSGGIATITYHLHLGQTDLLNAGDVVNIDGVNNAGYDIEAAIVTAVDHDNQTISYALPIDPGGDSFGGVITRYDVESGNSRALSIVYDSGNVVLDRPNAPQMTGVSASGRTLSVKFSLDTFQELQAATSVKLFASMDPAHFDFTTPIGTVSITPSTARIIFGTVSGDVSTDGPYYWIIRTDSANGQSLNDTPYGPIKLATALPPDPSFSVSGGF